MYDFNKWPCAMGAVVCKENAFLLISFLLYEKLDMFVSWTESTRKKICLWNLIGSTQIKKDTELSSIILRYSILFKGTKLK